MGGGGGFLALTLATDRYIPSTTGWVGTDNFTRQKSLVVARRGWIREQHLQSFLSHPKLAFSVCMLHNLTTPMGHREVPGLLGPLTRSPHRSNMSSLRMAAIRQLLLIHREHLVMHLYLFTHSYRRNQNCQLRHTLRHLSRIP